MIVVPRKKIVLRFVPKDSLKFVGTDVTPFKLSRQGENRSVVFYQGVTDRISIKNLNGMTRV